LLHDDIENEINISVAKARISLFILFELCFAKFETNSHISKIRNMNQVKQIFATVLLLLSCLVINAQIETYSQGDLSFLKLPNGLNIVLKNSPSAQSTEVSFHIRLGSIYEQDSFSGISNVIQHILSNKIQRHLSNTRNSLNSKNCIFTSYVTTEQSVFKFSVSTWYVKNCFDLMVDSVYTSTIRELELKYALETINEELSQPLTSRQKMDSTLLRKLYRVEYDRLNVPGNPKRFENFVLAAVQKHKVRYYKSDNTICTINGSFQQQSLIDNFAPAAGRLFKGDYDPESITKIIDIKPMIYSSQLVFDDTVESPEFHVCWQFPGAYSNQKDGHKSYLLSSILNDKNNYIQVKAAKLNCKKLAFQYEANNFSSVLRIIIAPSKDNLMATYNMVVSEMQRIDKVLINESMINAGKVIFKKEFEAIKKTQDYPDWVARFWPYNDDNFFTSLADSIMNIKLKELQKFTHEYVNEGARVSALLISPEDRVALKVDSQFVDLNDSIMNYTFNYKPNVTELEGAENLSKQFKLLQWLKINPDIHIQVNGFSDKSEFNKVSDDSVLVFIDSISTFRKAMPDIIKKRNMRPETMRAMRIVKYLYENGIEADRLSGTSMCFTSNNRNDALANMKCTISLEKLRDKVSLFEYHYGKKME
jgi:zinc protease